MADTEVSLADLFDLDVSDISEIRFELLPQGVYDFKIVESKLAEGTNRDGDKVFNHDLRMEVVECVAALESGVDRDSLVGKSYSQRQQIPLAPQEDTLKAIGRIRALATDVGLESAGKLGELVDRFMDHGFRGKIVHTKDKNDPSVVYARLRLDPPKK